MTQRDDRDAGDDGAGRLRIEQVGVHVLIARVDRSCARERSFLAGLACPSGEAFVMLADDAGDRDLLRRCLPDLVASAITDGVAPVDTWWVGIAGMATLRSWWQELVDGTDSTVHVPAGPVEFVLGVGVLARGDPGARWIRFAAGEPPAPAGSRFPRPRWDAALGEAPDPPPATTVREVLAGLALGGDGSSPVAALDPQRCSVLVEGPPPDPSSAAALLAELAPRVDGWVALMPATAQGADPDWLAAVARHRAAPITTRTGLLRPGEPGGTATVVLAADGAVLFRPFGTVLEVHPDGRQEVLEVAAPPAGWARSGPREYRRDVGSGPLRAEVLPSGIRLTARPATGPAPPPLPFDPDGWTLVLGSPGETVDDPLVTAAEALVEALDEETRRCVHVELGGTLADVEPAAVEPVEPAAVEPTAVEPASAAPVAAPPGLVTESRGLGAARPVERPPGEGDGTASLRPHDPDRSPGGPAPDVEPAVAPEPRAVAHRPSTAQERARFAEYAGPAFLEALATVNAALATWPALRRDQEPTSKADYAAVCLYLDGDATGAENVQAAMRDDRVQADDGHLACLVSGLMRLPTHRRPVLRQGLGTAPPERPGELLGDPGFLGGSTELDVTVPGAGYDVLIWPRTARRMRELVSERTVDEAIFLPGATFRQVGWREVGGSEPGSGPGSATEVPDGRTPAVAVLLRELAPDEVPGDTEVAARDSTAADRLDRALAARRRAAVRRVEVPEIVTRLTRPLVPVVASTAASSAPPAVSA